MRQILRIVGLALTVAGFTGTASAATIGFATDTNQDLWAVNFDAVSATLIGHHGRTLQGLALSSGGALYGTDNNGVLYSIDPITGASTLIGSTGIGAIEGLDFNGSALVGTNFGAATTTYEIDTTTAGVTALGTMQSGPVRGMAVFDATTGFAASDSPDFQTLVRYNLLTGAFTNVGLMSNAVFGLDFSGGQLYGVGLDGALYRIDSATGVATYLGSTGNQFYLDLALSPTAAVPEPATLILLGSGVLVPLLRRRAL